MSNYRQHAYIDDLRTKRPPWRFRDLCGALSVVSVILGAYVFAQQSDERAERQEAALIAAERQRLPIPSDVQAAYERGVADAVLALRDGAQAAPACSETSRGPSQP